MTATDLDLAITGAVVVIPSEGELPATVGVRGERIAALLAPDADVRTRETIDASGMLVFPGVIDPHTHIGYEGYRGIPLDALPGHFETETASALIGGVTTLLCTYRNAASYEEIFEEMRSAGEAHSRIDFGYSLGITNDTQLARIADYHRRFGITSFKFYMAYRGDEAKATGNVYNTYDDGLLFEGMEAIGSIPGGVAMVHAENIEIIARRRARLMADGRNDLAAWSESRPDLTEAENVRRALYLAEEADCPLYIPHLTCRKSLDAVREHRERGTTPAWVETCTQYLTHTQDSKVGILGKVNPPLRGSDDLEALWEGLRAGDVDTVATDHCGVGRDVKSADIWTAVPGFPGMATLLPVLLDAATQDRISYQTVAEVSSRNAARIFNLYPRKGSIRVGADADLVIVDPHLTRTVTPELLHSRSDFSIYEGRELTGWPVLTLARGRVAMRGGDILASPGDGRYLSRFVDDPEGVTS